MFTRKLFSRRVRPFITCLAALMLALTIGAPSSEAQQCQIIIDSVTFSNSDTLIAGNTHVAFLRVRALCGAPEDEYNMGMAFALHSPDGATIGGITAERLAAWTSIGWSQLDSTYYKLKSGGSGDWGPNVSSPLTISATDSAMVGFVGAGVPGSIMPVGFDDQTWTITFETDVSDAGYHFCIDSVTVQPGFEWAWYPGDGSPEIIPLWGGPYCFIVEEFPNAPPEITNCPVQLSSTYPVPVTYTFEGDDPEGQPLAFRILNGPGVLQGSGEYSFTPTIDDVDQSILLEIVVSDGSQDSDPCFVDIHILPSDSDGDGVLDEDDNCLNVPNPLQENSDTDQFGDACDNCDTIDNPGQENADEDEFGDDCDDCTDTDGDGYGDPGFAANTCTVDNCPVDYNDDQSDADGDGIGDICDDCTDSDGDGYGDPGYPANTCPEDNCPDTPNPSQVNTDGDGKGDACDPGEVLFSATPRCGSGPMEVTFTDESVATTTITGWHWEFGDGNWSDLQSPVYEYQSDGAFDVSLAIFDDTHWDTLIKTEYVVVQNIVTADFSALPSSGQTPLAVVFDPVLEGAANSYLWKFGDGETSTLQNPIHTYADEGQYDVTLVVRMELDGCTHYDSLTQLAAISATDVRADFTAFPTAGIGPLTVDFSDLSGGGISSWRWDFGDDNTSTVPNPSHTYDTAGQFDVKLWVSDGTFEDSLVELSYIRVDTAFCDLAVDVMFWEARPGFEFIYDISWTNIGTYPANACTLFVTPPPEMTQIDIIDVYDQSNGGTGTYSGYYPDVNTLVIPLATIDPSGWIGGAVSVFGVLPDSIAIGQDLVLLTWIRTPTAEVNLINNAVEHHSDVVGSIDPNDKSASPVGSGLENRIMPDQRLSYLIQYENKPEATAAAIYVRVVDTLSPLLDWSTLTVGQMSDPDVCDWDFDPYTGVLTWFCDSIMLPPNHVPPEGEGWLTYSISPLPGLPEGTELANTCWIRFDYNEWLMGPEDGPVVRTITYGCCEGFSVGNMDMDGSSIPDMGDLTLLIDMLFISLNELPCLQEADVDFSNQPNPAKTDITMGDLTVLIDNLFISLNPLPACP